MLWTSGLPAAMGLWSAILIIQVAGILAMGLFEEELKAYPVVGVPSADARRSFPRAFQGEAASRAALHNEERVHFKPDGTVSFDCPRSVCGVDFYFGRAPKEEESQQFHKKLNDNNGTSRASFMQRVDETVANISAQLQSRNSAEEPLLRDIVHITDMTWLGTDEKMHQLAFMKNSTCGGLYFAPSQLPVATADVACSLSNLDVNSVYIKRFNSHRLRLGPGVKLMVSMSSTFALKTRDRNWRRKLVRSPSLRLLVFFAQTFGRLNPNILNTNPGLVINEILLKNKHLFYPLTELCLYVKVCETVQTYPERLLQGFPGHVHPDHPSYVQLPIYSYFRKTGAEVAFPKDAPIIFQPRIYDGNIPVDRTSSSSKFDIFALAAELIFGSKAETQRGLTQSASTDPARGLDSGAPQKKSLSNENDDIQNEEVTKEEAHSPDSARDPATGKATGVADDEWKRQMYRAWHSLWILNLVAYEASDIWEWVKNHKASTFMFPPWKVTDVGVLRTAEVVPMRWRDLSPRFHVESSVGSSSEPLSQQDLTRGQGIPHTSGEQMGTGGTGEPVPPRGSTTEGIGPSFPPRAYEEDAMVDDGYPEGFSTSNSLASSKEAKRHTDLLGDKIHTMLSTATEGQADASTPQETFGANAFKSGGTREEQRADVSAGRVSGTEGNTSSTNEVPEGCIPYLTDMSFFKKLGWPSGRLVTAGPSGSMVLDEAGSTKDEWVDGSWRPKIIDSDIKCLPVVHPDTCGLTASFSRAHESPWVWLLERDEQAIPSNRAGNLDYADTVWIFRGTFVSKQWLLNGMGVAVPYRTLSKRGHFHYGLTYLFDKAVRPLMERYLERLEHQVVGRKTPLVVVFTGHSLGAAIAEMSSWYFAKRAKTLVDKGMLQIRTVAFGSPSWGDQLAYEDMVASGVKAQEINMDIDPVAVLFGEEDLTRLSHKKPFLMKLYIEDMDKVEVASPVPGAPPFSGRIWTRPIYRPTPILRRLAAMFLDLENVDMVLLNPTLAHFVAYTASLTIMAGLLEEASFGSGVAAPLADAVYHLVGHPRNVALKKAHEQLSSVLRRVDADRSAEEGSTR